MTEGPADTQRWARRRLLLTLAAAPIAGAALAGCTSDRPAKRPPLGDPPDADSRVRWRAVRTEHGLIVLHAAAISAHGSLAEVIGAATAHHREHLNALLADGPLPRAAYVAPAWRDGSADGDTDLTGRPLRRRARPDIPDSPEATLDLVRESERAAADTGVAECLLAGGPALAVLLASIAAAEAAHEITLAEA